MAALLAPGSRLYAQAGKQASLDELVSTLEDRLGARIGVMFFDTEDGRTFGHRITERFSMCSTFKALAGAALLARINAGKKQLGRRIIFGKSELKEYAPITKDHIGGAGMSLGELCSAAIATSDNTAGNLILKSIGGPGRLTEYLRSVGDTVTRRDRWEPELNEGKPGDIRDTTTPAALTKTIQEVVQVRLDPASRDQLLTWLKGSKVGNTKVRAGIPKEWAIGDKTGGGGFGTNNDTGIIWPTGRKPVYFTIMMTETTASFEAKNAAMTSIASGFAASVRS